MPASQPVNAAPRANAPPGPDDSAQRPSLLQKLRGTAQNLFFGSDHLVLLTALLLANGLRLHFRGWITDALFGAIIALLGLSLFREGGVFGAARQGRGTNGNLLLTPLCFAALLALYGLGLALEPSSQGLRNFASIFCIAIVFLFFYQSGPALIQDRGAKFLFAVAALALLTLYWVSANAHAVLLSVYLGYALLAIGLLLVARCKSRRAQHLWAHIALLAAMASALAFGFRTQALAMLLAYPFYWIAQRLLRSRRGAGLLAGGTLALACLVTTLFGTLRFNEQLANLQELGWSYTGGPLHTGRDLLIRASLSGILDAPWLGKGPAAEATRQAANVHASFGPEEPYCLKWANRGLLDDCHILLKARNALAGSDRTLLWSWNFDKPITSWQGVTLAGAPPRIQSLDLSNAQLTGRIPAKLGGLSELAVLRLDGNHLRGRIPETIGKLSRLTALHLEHNALSGAIPKTLGDLANLEVLRLENNRLRGKIPEELTALSKLSSLGLHGNDFANQAPPELQAIADRDLRQVLFCLPSTHTPPGLLKDCAILLEMRDALAGDAEILNWRHDLPIHRWQGVELGESPARVVVLHLSGAGLSGRIPALIGGLDALFQLHLNRNRLRGEVPAELGALPNLHRLHLAGNSFDAPMPAGLRTVAEHDLDEDLHCVQGPRIEPGLLADCATLLAGRDLLAGNGQLNWRRSLPIGRWQGVVLGESPARVVALNLAGMGLEGQVPPVFGRLGQLAELYLQDNQLVGAIPAELAALKRLRHLNLSGNAFDEAMPVALRDIEARNFGKDRFCPRASQADSDLVADCNLLLSIRDALAGRGFLNWRRDLPIAAWQGVHLSGDPLRLSALSLNGMELSGRIPPELGKLTSLRILRLQNNALTGPIPAELGRLEHLRLLNLSVNRLSGFIPPQLSALDLRVLRLGQNDFSGPVPPNRRIGPRRRNEQGNLREAQRILAGADLATGPFCRQASESNPGLQADCGLLLAAQNALAGSAKLNWAPSMPIHFWQGVSLGGTPVRVIALDLSRSGIDGVIPPELSGLEQLASLRLQRNGLAGAIPPELGQLARLQELLLSGNALTGAIPKELGDLGQLTTLHLRRNRLEGPIPPELGKLTNLRSLALDGNALTGAVPAELGGLLAAQQPIHSPLSAEARQPEAAKLFCDDSSLKMELLRRDCGRLLAARDELAGDASLNWSLSTPITAWQGIELGVRPVRVTALELPRAQLSGRIPEILNNLIRLESLRLEGNRLTGEIPEFSELQNLKTLSLDDNALTGKMPESLAKLEQLELLGLSDNRLTGVVPQSLSRLPELRTLRLGGNRFSGCLPEALRQVADRRALLDLRCDASPWAKPPLFEDAALLMGARAALAGDAELNWRHDRPISAWQGVTLSGRPARVAALQLSDSGLNGEIPPQLGALDGLLDLRLSDNQLAGPIPPELGDLASLHRLWLDGNRLTGPVPPTLGQLGALEDLRLDGNALSGCRDPSLLRLDRFLLPLQLPHCSPDWQDELAPVGRFIYATNVLVNPAPELNLAESSHNVFLQIGLQSGLLGMAALALLCLSLIFNLRCREEAKPTPVQCFTAACAFTAIFQGAFEIFLLQHFLSAAIFVWATLGIGTGLVRRKAGLAAS